MQTLREKIENIRFILLDMDGTMFNAAHRIDAETADVMRQLMDKGYYVAAATGRGLATLQPLLNPLRLDARFQQFRCVLGDNHRRFPLRSLQRDPLRTGKDLQAHCRRQCKNRYHHQLLHQR